jgi:Ca2+-binding RTX toxin-like protein
MNGETYRMEFRESNNAFDMHVMEMPYGDSVTYEIHGLDIATRFTEIEKFSRDDNLSIREVSSLDMLNASTDTAVFRDIDTGVIHMKFVADGKVGWHNANAGATFDDALMTGAMIHVDQSSGSLVDLDDLAFDDPDGPADDRFDGTGGDDLYYAFSGNDTLLGRDGDDTVYGGLGNDQISGGRGDDDLYGNSGNDRLRGQSGDDFMTGNSGNDDLRGGGGADTLIGGAGSDRLHGGGGSDTFVLAIDKTFGVTGSKDTIRDFVLGTDVLEFADLSPQDDLDVHIQIETSDSGSLVSVRETATEDPVEIAMLEGLSVTLDDLIASDAILV